MTDIFNLETGQKNDIPEAEWQSAIESGTHGFKTGIDVPVLDPDGVAYGAPVEKLPELIKQGYVVETPTQSTVREKVAQIKEGGTRERVKDFLKNAGNEFLFGVPGAIYDNTENPLDVEARERYRQEAPVADAIAKVLGIGSSFLIGGELLQPITKAGRIAEGAVVSGARALGGRKLATSTAGKAARTAAKIGVETGLITAPRNITEEVLGNPEAAAEGILLDTTRDVLMGGAIAGAGSAMFSALKGIGRTANVFSKSGEVTERLGQSFTTRPYSEADMFADTALLKSLGYSKATLKRLKVDDIASTAKIAREEGFDKILESTNDKIQRAEKARIKYREALADAYTNLDTAAGEPVFDLNDAADFIQTKLTNKYMLDNALNEDLKASVESRLNQLRAQGQGRPISFMAAWENKQILGTKYEKTSNDVNNKIQKEMFNLFGEYLNNKAEAVSQMVTSPELAQSLHRANQRYSALERITKGLDNALAQKGNNLFGLSTTILGGAGFLSGGIDTAISNVVAAKLLQEYGGAISSKVVNTLSSSLERISQAFDNRLTEALTTGTKTAAKPAALDILGRIIDDDTAKGDAAKIEALQKSLSFRASDPEGFKATAGLTQAIADHAPLVSVQLDQKLNNGLGYILAAIPKVSEYNPFEKSQYSPTKRQISAFKNKLQIVVDPLSATEEIKNGTLTDDHVEALKVVYPRLYDLMIEKVTQKAQQSDEPLDYQRRLKIRQLLGSGIGQTMKPQTIQNLQNNFITKQQNTNQGSKRFTIAEQNQTDINRITSRS